MQHLSFMQMKNKMQAQKGLYSDALKWKHSTGNGLNEDDGELSIEERIARTCPFFEELDIIYGKKKSVNPVQVRDTEDECVEYEYVQEEPTPPKTPPEEASENIDAAEQGLPEEECKYCMNM